VVRIILVIISIVLLVLAGCVTQQPVVQEEPFCTSPYFEYKKGECCLDANSNNICDTDEDQKEVMVTPEPKPDPGTNDEERIGKGEFEVGDRITIGCYADFLPPSRIMLIDKDTFDDKGVWREDVRGGELVSCDEFKVEVTVPFFQSIKNGDTDTEYVGFRLLDSNKEFYLLDIGKEQHVKEMYLYEIKQKELRTGWRDVFEEEAKGSTTKTTQSFYVTSDEWKVSASYGAYDPDYLGMVVYVYRKGSNQLVTLLSIEGYAMESGGAYAQAGETYVYEGPGEYYLEVTPANVASWSVSVSEKI